MNLQPISKGAQMGYVFCCMCGGHTPMEDAKADLDGPAFLSYVCKRCERDYIARKGQGPKHKHGETK